MNICSGTKFKHQEICFEGSDCPLCEALEQNDILSDDLAIHEERIKELENSNG